MSDDDDSNFLKHLKTVTLFDKENFESGEGFSIPRKQLASSLQSSLLIEALVEYICILIEEDTATQKRLYETICQKLYELQFIDNSYSMRDLDFIRHNYQKELHRLLSAARSTSSVIQCRNAPDAVVSKRNYIGKCRTLFEWSRYYNEYHELEFIARGGFGEVVKVQNKLDAGIYAIKKICLRYCSINGFIRGLSEVQMLAKLNHPNIVSYRAAWLEPLRTVQKLSKKSRKALCEPDESDSKKSDSRKSDSKKDTDSSDIIFAESDHSKTGDKNSNDCESNSFSDSVPELSDDHCKSIVVDDETSTRAQFIDNIRHPSTHECGQDWAILFIQMQLCYQTLRNWLDIRNNEQNSIINVDESLHIFSQIVKGVEFIHSKGIVHHDIKPNNIFISQDGKDVQVGDFGLSCCLLHDACPDTPAINIFSSPNCPVSNTRQRGEIGTKLYAAPEQLNGVCHYKSDLYSLGILLFELVYFIHTSMERIEKINDLRENTILPATIEENLPSVARLIKLLVNIDLNQRPTATELLKEINSLNELHNVEEDKVLTIQKLRHELMMKNEDIALLKKQISMLKMEATSDF